MKKMALDLIDDSHGKEAKKWVQRV
jgi:hypothetical protein